MFSKNSVFFSAHVLKVSCFSGQTFNCSTSNASVKAFNTKSACCLNVISAASIHETVLS